MYKVYVFSLDSYIKKWNEHCIAFWGLSRIFNLIMLLINIQMGCTTNITETCKEAAIYLKKNTKSLCILTLIAVFLQMYLPLNRAASLSFLDNFF